MAGVVILKPEAGLELADILTKVLDGVVLEKVQMAFDAARSLGDDNHVVEEIKRKFMAFQDKYNNDAVPASNKAKQSFEEFTDFAEYIKKLQVDTGVRDVEVGTVKPNSYDAAKNL